MKRALPLLCGVHASDAATQQMLTSGLSYWLPYFGSEVGGSGPLDHYRLRSAMTPYVVAASDLHGTELDQEGFRRWYEEWRELAPFLLQDYYPLTPHTLSPTDWVAWQFHAPRRGVGFVQAFRREESPTSQFTVRLRGLAADQDYMWWTTDDADTRRVQTGHELLEEGILLTCADPRTAIVVVYMKAR